MKQISSEQIEAVLNYCHDLYLQERFAAASDAYQQQLIITPHEPSLLLGLGRTLMALNQPEAALLNYEKLLENYPNHLEGLGQYGEALIRLNRFQAARQIFDRALQLQPQNLYLRWQRGIALLSLGDLINGWNDYEGRRYNWLPLPFTEWQGESLINQTLLVLAEQGLGDEILFASCLPDLKNLVNHVIIECEPRLVSLYRRSFPWATIKGVIRSDRLWLNTLGKVDKAVALGSLPRFLRRQLKHFPEKTNYLKPDSQRKNFWQQRLAALGNGDKIGICWRSQLMTQGRHFNYSKLENDWGELLKINGVHFINLQYDDCQVELAASARRWGITIHQFADLDLKNDLDDLAALCANLDLVISAGTAVAELAAAVGTAVWRLETTAIPWTCLGSDYFPWHPQIKLFKQTQRGVWQPVFADLKQHLINKLNSKLLLMNKPTPQSVDALLKQAITMHEAGNFIDAAKFYRDYLIQAPNDQTALYYFGTLQCQQNQIEQALPYLEKLITLQPQHIQGLNNLGLVLAKLKRWNEAEQYYRQALALQPDYAHAWNNLGGVLENKNLLEEAFECYEKALSFKPDYHDGWYNLGRVCYKLERYQEAEYQFLRIINQYPNDVNTLNYLGAIYKLQDKPEQALIYLEKAIKIEPTNLDSLNNIAAVYQQLNRFSEALAYYDRALTLQQDAQVHFNRGFILFSLGRLGEGWDEYVFRKQLYPTPQFNLPFWQGESLTGKTIFIHGEQGIGDEILFVSCLNEIIQQAELCIVQCEPRLASLLKRSFPQAIIKGINLLATLPNLSWLAELPNIDYVCALGDLPRQLRRELTDFPEQPAYLIPDANEVAQWRQRLATFGSKVKIGICWRSGRFAEGRHRHYSRLEDWQPILKLTDFVFVNLQYDECSAELALAQKNYNIEIIQFPDLDLKNELDRVAALCQALDGVISAPTAVAEIAGAVGAPVWRIDPLEIAWTTFGTGQFFWHPRTRIFSQMQHDDWQTPLIQIAQDLMTLSKNTINDVSISPTILITAQNKNLDRKLIDEALIYYKKSDFQQTEILLNEYLNLNGDDAEVYEIKGMINLNQQEYNAAIHNFEKAITLNPKLTYIYARLATAQKHLNLLAEAEASYRQGIKIAPKFAHLYNDLANILIEQKRFEEAKKIYLQALRLKPDLVEAHNNLAAIFLEQDKPDEAIRTLQDALRLRPHFGKAHLNLGRAFAKNKNWENAFKSYHQALIYDPNNADIYNALGNLAFEQNNYQDAIIQYRTALELNPELVWASFSLGNALQELGQLDEAIQIWRNNSQLASAPPEMLCNLASALQKRNENIAAVTLLKQVLEKNPTFLPAIINLANVLSEMQQSDLDEADKLLQQALLIDPNNPEIHASLGHVLFLQNKLEAAESHCYESLRLRPGCHGALVNLSLILQYRGKLTDAEIICREGLNSYPDSLGLLKNLGRTLKEQNRFAESLIIMDKVLTIDGDNPTSQWERSLPLLAMGDLQAGWEAYEQRRKTHDRRQGFNCPDWNGSTKINGNLLIYAEQGLGDELFFAACISDILAIVENCIIECDPRLTNLYQRSFPKALIRGFKRDDRAWSNNEKIDAQIPVGSLSFIFRQHLNNFPTHASYLLADPERVNYWQTRLQSLGTGLKIGICWRSSLIKGSRHLYYSSLDQWSEIFAVAGVHFINLQYDQCADELNDAHQKFGITITNFTEIDLKNDLDEAAALTASLDLVISAGTAASEMAACLGVPIWRIDSTQIAWTSFGTDAIPYHRRSRIFRQHKIGEWNEVLNQVASALSELAKHPESAKQQLDYPLALKLNEAARIEQMRYQFMQGNWQRAELLGERWINDYPNNYQILDMLGIAVLKQKNFMTARDYLTRALNLNPDYYGAYYHLGLVTQEQRDFNAAQNYYLDALKINPNFALAHNNLGNVLLELGNYQAAELHYREALRIDPKEFKTYNNLAVLLKKDDRIDEAIQYYRQALSLNAPSVNAETPRYLDNNLWQPLILNPVIYEIHANLGNALLDRGDLEESETHYRLALTSCPDNITVLNGLSDVLREQGRIEEALNYHHQALAINPESASANWNLCLTQLTAGDLDNGWQGYEWRFHAMEIKRTFPWTEWNGSALPNERLFIYAEQGLGDEILFASCFSDVIDQVGHCIIECDPRLQTLFARSFPRATVRGQNRCEKNWVNEIEPIAAQIPMGSLPVYFRRQIEHFPQRTAYLQADPARVLAWRNRLTTTFGGELCIGIIWRSGILGGRRRLRYSSLDQWGNILKTPNVHFINVQYDECQAELDEARRLHNIEIIEFPDLNLRNNLDELAAFLTALDGVIGAGTATTSLAAALGTPVWRLDPFLNSWVTLGKNYLPWQLSTRIFKQPHWNDWTTPINEIAQALSVWALGHKHHLNTTKLQLEESRFGWFFYQPEDGRGLTWHDYLESLSTKIKFWQSLIKINSVVIDTKAGIGDCAIPLGNIVGSNGLVIAYEPSYHYFQRLCANVAINHLHQVKPYQQVLSDQAADTIAAYYGADIHTDTWDYQQKISVTTIDNLALPRCDFIRIRYETHEYAIIKGAELTIRQFKPFIYVENFRGAASVGWISLLENLGYKWLLQNNTLAGTSIKTTDLLAFPVA